MEDRDECGVRVGGLDLLRDNLMKDEGGGKTGTETAHYKGHEFVAVVHVGNRVELVTDHRQQTLAGEDREEQLSARSFKKIIIIIIQVPRTTTTRTGDQSVQARRCPGSTADDRGIRTRSRCFQTRSLREERITKIYTLVLLRFSMLTTSSTSSRRTSR